MMGFMSFVLKHFAHISYWCNLPLLNHTQIVSWQKQVPWQNKKTKRTRVHTHTHTHKFSMDAKTFIDQIHHKKIMEKAKNQDS